jgi:hypothetical protein
MSTLKVDTLDTSNGTGNITLSRPLSGSGASLTSLPAANLTGTLPAIDGSNLTGVAPTKATVEALGIDVPAANLTGTVADARISTLTASKLSGTIDGARLPDPLPAIDGSSLTGVGVLDEVNTWTKGQRAEITALVVGATITLDLNHSNNFSFTLTGNSTLANPSNLTAGQSGSVFITQDGTGSRTLGYGTYWDWADGEAPTLTTTASATDRIDYIVLSTTSIHAVCTLTYS